jgi:Antitoxin-like ribbon-helix-helix
MAKVNPGTLFKPKANEVQPVGDSTLGPKKPKRGKHLISGLFEQPTYRQFTMLAAELGLQRQGLLREALNDLFVKYGKPPIA